MARKKVINRYIAMMITSSMLVGNASLAYGMEVSAFSTTIDTNYVGNQGELIETPFIQLPPTAIKAEGWLKNQLLLQKNGLTGNMEKYTDYNKETSAWLGDSGENWERGPYYLRGLVSLAYVLEDEELMQTTQNWVEAILTSQQPSGFFGPTSNTDWWPRMPILMALRDYYEATEAMGKPDERVIPFMEKYFRYQEERLPYEKLYSWASARGGDNIDSVFWLYNRLYNESNPEETKWLLELAELLYTQTTDWTKEYNDTTVRQHVVNTSQGMKTPAVYYQYNKKEENRDALQNGLFNMGLDHGRIDGLPNSDEGARDNRSTRGSETCGVVESMLSTEIAVKILGEVWVGDRLEKLAYNAMPTVFTPDYSGHTYYILQNQIMATQGAHEFDNDHGDSSAFGAPLGFDCCYSNVHMGWPKFVQNMWMATANNGLAIVAYGPSTVTARVADNQTAVFEQTTDYPFKDQVKLTYSGDQDITFELLLRIPEWCQSPTVKVNGEMQQGVNTGEYYQVERNWQVGDIVEVSLPSKVATSTWYNESIAVEKGPLIYGLKIEEDWRVYEENDLRELKVEHQEQSPLREVYPASRWNYGLIVDEANPGASFEIVEKETIADQPFTVDNAPVVIKAKGQIIPEWVADGNLAGPQPFGAIPLDENLVENIELIPYASGKLKITHFPKIGEAQETVKRDTDTYGEIVKINGEDILEFDNIIVPQADNYTLKIQHEGTGSGQITLNGKYTQNIEFGSGISTVDNLKDKLSGGFRFDAGQYNNLRIKLTEGVTVTGIEVVPVNRKIQEVTVNSAQVKNTSIKLSTNLDSQETPFKVVYGRESGNYTNEAYGYENLSILLSNLEKDTTYYVKIIATIDGIKKASQELVYTTKGSNDTGLKPDPNVPQINFKDSFDSPNYSLLNWKEFDSENKIEFNGDKYHFGEGAKVKSIVDLPNTDENTWSDYVIETKLTLDSPDGNSAGVMFRATGVGEEPDAYKGYFAGIGYLNLRDGYRGTGLMIGYADGSWHDLYPIKDIRINPNQEYILKIVAFKDNFAIYLDNELITVFKDDKFSNGTVGLRSYMESFVAEDFSIRSIKEEDLAVFQSTDGPSQDAHFEDDFEDVEVSQVNWKLHGDTSKMTFNEGKLNIGISSNVKAMAGEESWTDYVVEADINVTGGSGSDAGIMFRTTDAAPGADSFNGYYFGIGNKGAIVGYADGKWHTISEVPFDISLETTYRLKVVAYQNTFAMYIDDQLVYKLVDEKFDQGQIGVRAFNKSFEVDNVVVRPVQLEELEDFDSSDGNLARIEISGESAFESLQIKYPRIANADRAKFEYGIEPGVYTHEIYDLKFNTYKGGGVFGSEKHAFTGLKNNQTYYVRVKLMSGAQAVAISNEIEVMPGSIAGTQKDRVKLTQAISKAEELLEGSYTSESLDNLNKTIIEAKDILNQGDANQMDLSVARALLEIQMNGLEEVDEVPKVTIQASQTVAGGSLLEVSIGLKDIIRSVYAQDLTLKYDSNLFEFVGIEGIGDKNYVAHEVTEGEVRVIVGTDGGAVSGDNSVTLKLQAKRAYNEEAVTTHITATDISLGLVEGSTSVAISGVGASKEIRVTPGSEDVDKSVLHTIIEEAKELSRNAVIGTEEGQYPQEAKNHLDTAILVAEEIAQNSTIQVDINQAVVNLSRAIQEFKDSKIEDKDTDVNEDGEYNIADLALVAYYYRTTPESSNWSEAKKMDFDNNKLIDIDDLVVVARKILEDN